MPEEMGEHTSKKDDPIGKYVSRILYESYVLMLLFSIIILSAGTIFEHFLDVAIATPVILILTYMLFAERKTVHIPPFMIFMMFGLMILVITWRIFSGGHLLGAIVDFLFGVMMGLGGLIITYSLMNTLPGLDGGKIIRVIFISMSVALSMFTIIVMVQYYLGILTDLPELTIDGLMGQLLFVILGALSLSVLFYFSKHSSYIQRFVTTYLEMNAVTMGVDEYEAMEIERALKSGEGEKVEYKSTLRTNLATREKDVRMEKAVLKTIVAFLNSNGGTLLIGVSDDGTVIGIDEYSFDNRDKLNLHLTNLIASQIGNEFLPYITFRLSDHNGKGVMRIVCKKSDSPVFLKEGKQETFYVRSGPSSVDLHGMDTLNYVDNRFKNRRKIKVF